MMNGSSEKNALTHEKPPVPFESNWTFCFCRRVVICGTDWSAG